MESGSSSQTKTWRFALRVLAGFVILYASIYAVRLIMGVGPNLLMRRFGASPDFRAFVGSTLNYGVGIAAYLLLPALAMRKLLGLDARPRFFPFLNGWWKDLLYGVLLIGIVLAIFFTAEWSTGWLALDGWNWQVLSGMAWLRVAWVSLLVNVGVAIGEETVFRGYLLTGLRTAWGKWTSLLLMTVIFGLFHLPAYIEGGIASASLALGIVLASLFGLMFGLAYLRTGTLWLPASLHFAWNFIENDLLNLTGDATNPNLVGAVTRLQDPLGAAGIAAVRVVLIETLAFGIVALGVWAWLRYRSRLVMLVNSEAES